MSANNLRDWTVMVYFSADNDLQDEAFNNLSQMVEVGGSDKVHVLAQIYSRKQIPTRRYFMRAPDDAVVTDVEDEKNVGSVDDLVEFVSWGRSEEHRAKNYLIVLWGHANGIFDDEDDVGTARAKLTARSKQCGDAMELGQSSDRSPVTPEVADNALTSFELKEAFERIQKKFGQEVAILGMDACLMSMAEIAKQVSGSVGLMVASEEVIPEKSWPYDRILQRLVDSAKTGPVEPEDLAKLIVDEYINCYQSAEDPVTLSACRLEKIDNLAGALDKLGRVLTDLLRDEELKKAVSKARRQTQMFLFREYVDLFDFCERLRATLKEERFRGDQSEEARRAAEEMMDVIGRNGGATSDFVLHCGSTSGKGGTLARAHGVSIYFPPLPSTYADLDLSEHTHWNNFVHEYMNKVFRKNRVSQGPQRPERLEPRAISGQPSESESPDKPSLRTVEVLNQDQPARNGEKARLLLPKGTLIRDLLSEVEETLINQAFLMIGEPAEIKVPEGTELDMPRKGSVKASTGTSTKASTGTSTKASTGTSTKASTGTSTKASTGTSTKAIRTVDGNVVVGWLDVPMCILNKAFSGGQTRRKLRNGTRIYPPTPAKGQTEQDVEPIIVINEVKFVVDEPEIYEEKPALKSRAHAN